MGMKPADALREIRELMRLRVNLCHGPRDDVQRDMPWVQFDHTIRCVRQLCRYPTMRAQPFQAEVAVLTPPCAFRAVRRAAATSSGHAGA
jgi:hypothetical protein